MSPINRLAGNLEWASENFNGASRWRLRPPGDRDRPGDFCLLLVAFRFGQIELLVKGLNGVFGAARLARCLG